MRIRTLGRWLACAGWLVAAGGPTGAAEALALTDPASVAAAEALRAGLRALEEGEPLVAVQAFEQARGHALVADHAAHLRLVALLAAGNAESVLAGARAFERGFADSPLRVEVTVLEGDAAAMLGKAHEARVAWARAIALTRDDERRAELRVRRARSFEAEGELRLAAIEWRIVWSELAATAAAAEAEAALLSLEQRGVASLRDVRSSRRRCEVLYAASHNEAALAQLDLTLRLEPDAGALLALREMRANLLFRLRRYAEAVDAFAALGDAGDARLMHARSLARAGRVEAAIHAFEAIAADGGSYADRARFLAATLYEGEDDADVARRLFSVVATTARDAVSRLTARWRLGWLAYRQGRFGDAARDLEALAREEPDPIAALRARYWQARSLARVSPSRGERSLSQLSAEYPFSYYGWRAHQRAPSIGRLPADPPILTRQVPDTVLERLRILLTAGLHDAVVAEAEAWTRRGVGLGDRLALGTVLAGAGGHHEAERLVVDVAQEGLARGVDPALRTAWELAWPLAFEPAVRAAAAPRAAVSDALVYSIMREESGYRPAVRSVVGARGLLQIMPTTAERLAEGLGWVAFDPEQLFVPEQNLAMGAYYLEQLLERFDGRVVAAVASYNAGPSAVSRWLEERGGLEEDEWVEAIPYDQTRSYVKRVLRSLHVYQELYPRAQTPASPGAR